MVVGLKQAQLESGCPVKPELKRSRTPIMIRALIQYVDDAISPMPVKWTQVPGHGNQQADKLAADGANKLQNAIGLLSLLFQICNGGGSFPLSRRSRGMSHIF